MSSEDKGFIVEYTVKDPVTGELKTKPKKLPPVTIITTTTAVSLAGELETRAWRINLDESEEQTRRVLKFHAKKELSLLDAGTNRATRRRFLKRLLEVAISLLPEDVEINIPYADVAKEVFPASQVRARRDFPKFLYLIKLIAYLHYYQRPRYKLPDGREVVVALPEDLWYALHIGGRTIGAMVMGLDARLKAFWERVRFFLKTSGGYITSRQAATVTGLSERRARHYLKKLWDEGYLLRDDSTRPYRYALRPEEPEITALSGPAEKLWAECLKATNSVLAEKVGRGLRGEVVVYDPFTGERRVVYRAPTP